MMAAPVVIVESNGIPVTYSATPDFATPMTVVDDYGIAVTLVDDGGLPVALLNPDGSAYVVVE